MRVKKLEQVRPFRIAVRGLAVCLAIVPALTFIAVVPNQVIAASDSWQPTSTINAPEDRGAFSMVWTGTEMIVWGGEINGHTLNTGGVYDPATDAWRATSTVGAPSPRRAQSAVWTGTKMIIWGGVGGNAPAPVYNDGAMYDPVTNTWSPVSTINAPSGRTLNSVVWTGSGDDCLGRQHDE